MRNYGTYICAECGQTFTHAPSYASHIWYKHKRQAVQAKQPETAPVSRLIPDQATEMVFHITPQEWVEWNHSLLEQIKHQQEIIATWEQAVADAARTIKFLEAEFENAPFATIIPGSTTHSSNSR